MDFKEFEKILKIGQEVWVCDYRLNDPSIEKPIRHVKPQKVRVCDNSDTKEKVYYSNVHFRPFNQKGELLKKVIKPFDNTGYRSFTGISLNIFLNKEECVNHYKKQCKIILKELKEEKERKLKFFEDKEFEINNLINQEF